MADKDENLRRFLRIYNMLMAIPVPLGAAICYWIHGRVLVELMVPYVVAGHFLVWLWGRTFKEKPVEK